jgi:hypothetical protein
MDAAASAAFPTWGASPWKVNMSDLAFVAAGAESAE